MIRGGAWNNKPRNLRSAYRNNRTPDNRNDNNGFRLASPPALTQCFCPEPVAFTDAPVAARGCP